MKGTPMTDPVTATSAIITSVSEALNMLKVIRGADNANAAEKATRDLQDYILKQTDRIDTYSTRIMSLDRQLLECNDKILELEQELKRRESYTLVEIGLGSKAYIAKDFASSDSTETAGYKTPAYVCQSCYDVRGKVVHLQPIFNRSEVLHKWTCGGCMAELKVHLFPPLDLSKVTGNA